MEFRGCPAFDRQHRRASFHRNGWRAALDRDCRCTAFHRNTVCQQADGIPGRVPPRSLGFGFPAVAISERLPEPVGFLRQPPVVFRQRVWRREQWSQCA